MKILFICSSLEPGNDGVGDYTRRLACELIRQGVTTSIIALNDRFVTDAVNETQYDKDTCTPVLRLPVNWGSKDRFKEAKKYVNDFNPEWLSLQFVIFGHHPKGLPFGFGKQLQFLGDGRKWHIMFHELWVGMEINASKKHWLWGKVQKKIISSLINRLKPEVTHTHTPLYQHKLSHLGINVQQLALFGNIPVISNETEQNDNLKSVKLLKFVIFGHIHPASPVKDFCTELAVYANKSKVEVLFTFIGNCGAEQKSWLTNLLAINIETRVLGQQFADNVSKILKESTIGISTTPPDLIEKSGSVAAMLEHLLPVICVPSYWVPSNFINLMVPKGIKVYKKGNLKDILDTDLAFETNNNVENISKQLISSLRNQIEYGQH